MSPFQQKSRRNLRAAAQVLRQLAEQLEPTFASLETPTLKQIRQSALFLANVARDEQHGRQIRSLSLSSDLLREPAWDILLELFICWAEDREMMVKDAYIVSGVPGATAHRCVGILEREGLIERSRDEGDGRRVLIQLTSQGAVSMGTYLVNRSRALPINP